MSILWIASNTLLLAIYIYFSWKWVDSSSSWWRSLRQPSWQPPDVVFGIIWPYNFAMLFVVAVLLRDSAYMPLWCLTFAGAVSAATAWGYEFYIRKRFSTASIALAIATAFTSVQFVITYSADANLAWWFAPYQIWIATATSLCVGYWYLNQRTK
jgi:tryptophan-rich sensory protein